VLAACPDNEWRLIFSLSRDGGLRCPSETLELKWSDVDWERGRIVIRESKTRARTIPLFAELRPHLEQAFEEAAEGTTYIISRYRGGDCNLRTQLLRILGRAGLSAWPRLFHNLRASRETELVRDFPIHVVCKWIGNSMKVAQKHYLQITDADYEKATSNPTSHTHAHGGIRRHAEQKTAVPLAFANDTAVQVPPAGVEQTRSYTRKPQPRTKGDVKSDVASARSQVLGSEAPSPEILKLATQLASLPPDALAALRVLLGERPTGR
jgi:hypothetical protein